MDRIPSPRLVDWSLLVLTVALGVTGLLTGVAGTPSEWWVFGTHGTLAILFVVFLTLKLVRVAHRLRPAAWDQGTKTSIAVGTVALAALGTGLAWTWGAPIWIGGFSVVTVHALLGLAVIPALVFHLRYRYHGLDRSDLEGRRSAIRYLLLGVLAGIVWRVQRTVAAMVGTVVRFTGSRNRGRFTGNAFPRTEWVADDPDPVDPESWSLTVDGTVSTPLTLSATELPTNQASTDAVLDCTSGWYTVQRWQGVRLGDLLETAGVQATGRFVTVTSVTGYRWTFSIDEAETLLLATHVGNDRINHAHGYPLRLVAPGHRGYRWVKWIDTITVRQTPDPGKWIAIFTSGFD